MTGGLVSSLHLLEPVPAFFITYLGVVSGLTIGYILGFKIGAPVLESLMQKKGIKKYLPKSNHLMDRYGSYALCISYFFPIIRHIVPYLVGIGRMPFKRYLLFSYTTGLVWTLLFFSVGRFFGIYIKEIEESLHTYGLYALLMMLAVSFGIWFVHQLNRSEPG